MKISVVVPTYKRLNDLKRCLTALDAQVSLPHEVVVVVKSFDPETLAYMREWSAKQSSYCRKFCTVTVSGVVYAMSQGAEMASGEVIAFTDDDSEPSSTWLLKMEYHYQNQRVGGVGGRDILVNHPEVPLRPRVGKLTWYGKLIGNHHLGYGPPREVDVLKGVNMSFRKHLIEFSPFLRGSGGPENHNEVGLCLRVKRLGHSLVYDPAVTVVHHVAPRIDTEQRTQFNAESIRNSAFNLQLSFLTWLPWHRKLLRLVYSVVVGDKAYPGLLRFLQAVASREVRVMKSYLPAQVGFLVAVKHFWQGIGHVGTLRYFSETRAQHNPTREDAKHV